MKTTKQQDIEIPLLERNQQDSRSKSHTPLPIQTFDTDPKPSLPKYLDFNIFNRIFFLWVTTIVNVNFLFPTHFLSLLAGKQKDLPTRPTLQFARN